MKIIENYTFFFSKVMNKNTLLLFWEHWHVINSRDLGQCFRPFPYRFFIPCEYACAWLVCSLLMYFFGTLCPTDSFISGLAVTILFYIYIKELKIYLQKVFYTCYVNQSLLLITWRWKLINSFGNYCSIFLLNSYLVDH